MHAKAIRGHFYFIECSVGFSARPCQAKHGNGFGWVLGWFWELFAYKKEGKRKEKGSKNGFRNLGINDL